MNKKFIVKNTNLTCIQSKRSGSLKYSRRSAGEESVVTRAYRSIFKIKTRCFKTTNQFLPDRSNPETYFIRYRWCIIYVCFKDITGNTLHPTNVWRIGNPCKLFPIYLYIYLCMSNTTFFVSYFYFATYELQYCSLNPLNVLFLSQFLKQNDCTVFK